MSRPLVTPTGKEVKFGDNDLIVSKTDVRGIITYANDVFIGISGYTEAELFGQPHNIIRHPDMPRCAFKLMWETLQSGQEFFAYVVNLAKSGDHYWVHAHVTPTFDTKGKIIGYHSNRRVPYQDAINKVVPLYAALLAEERRHSDPRAGMEASTRMLVNQLNDAGMSYNEFVFSLSESTQLETSQ